MIWQGQPGKQLWLWCEHTIVPAALRSAALIQASPKAALMGPPATFSSMPALQNSAVMGQGGVGRGQADIRPLVCLKQHQECYESALSRCHPLCCQLHNCQVTTCFIDVAVCLKVEYCRLTCCSLPKLDG